MIKGCCSSHSKGFFLFFFEDDKRTKEQIEQKNTLAAPKETAKGFLSSGTTGELSELQAALRAAQLSTTTSDGLFSFITNFNG